MTNEEILRCLYLDLFTKNRNEEDNKAYEMLKSGAKLSDIVKTVYTREDKDKLLYIIEELEKDQKEALI